MPQPIFAVNNACVYYDDEKKIWHRALIEHLIDQNHCIIRLVDHGKSKYTNRSSLRDIYDAFLELPCQVAQASLNDMKESENLDEILVNKFKGIIYKNCLGLSVTNYKIK